MHMYESGIFSKEGCSTIESLLFNHAVNIVGYDKKEKYWIIRNSWGPEWGEDGYIRIEMGQNTCNMESYAWYPII